MQMRTITQWFLFLCGATVYGFWLHTPAARGYAVFGAALFGMWLGAIFAVADAEGKRDRYLIVVSVLLMLAAAWIGAKIRFDAAPYQPPFQIYPDGRLLIMSPRHLKWEEHCILWLCLTAFGWLGGFTAAVTQKNGKHTLGFGAALLFTVVAVLPWPAVAVCAIAGTLQPWEPWLGHILLLSAAFALALELLLLIIAGFRRTARTRRCYYTLGVTALAGFALWGIAEACFQWDVRQLRREYPYRAQVLTPEEQHTLALFRQVQETERAYNKTMYPENSLDIAKLAEALQKPGGLPQLPKPAPVPPSKGSERWLPRRFSAHNAEPAPNIMVLGSEYVAPLATEEYKLEALALDASEECNAFFDAFEQLLAEEHLVLPADSGSPIALSSLSSIRSLTQWLVGRAQLRHYAGDTAGVVHYLDRTLRMGELWSDDISLIGQLVRVALDNMALSAIVALGPEGPEYADTYRGWLRRAQMRTYEQLGEPDILASDWDQVLAGGMMFQHPKQPATLLSWFLNPLTLRLLAQEFRYGEQAQAQFDLVRQQVADGIPLAETAAKDFARDSARKTAEAFLTAEARLPIALALKLYRSLHGEYPESLDQLVPEILLRLPNLPATGKPPTYSKIENYFELDAASHRQVLRPVADY